MANHPTISIIMANRNGAKHIGHALNSVQAQSLQAIEILVVDDASTDTSPAMVEAMAAADPRIRLIRRRAAGGPAAARNTGLACAQGEWIAIMDADDVIAPERLAVLLAEAQNSAADLIADDLILFDDTAIAPPHRLLGGDTPGWVDAAGYIAANHPFSRIPQLGYLKPLIRRSAVAGLRYDETLRIAEDYDLVLRLLLSGIRLRILPTPLYFYRRHSQSISSRMAPGALAAMRAADAKLRALPGVTPAIAAALDARLLAIGTAETVEAVVAAVKALHLGQAAQLMAARPAALPILARFGMQALRRRLPARQVPPLQPGVTIISRQRLTPGANGSSAYLTSLCAALRQAGMPTHLVSPTPGSFGRVPVLRIDALDQAFDSMAFRGGRRLGPWLFATSPAVYAAAARGIAARLMARAGLTAPPAWRQPAPYAIALPWTGDDLLFVTAQSRGRSAAVLADYAFSLPAIGHTLAPVAPVAVLMHDLFSQRAESFARQGARDSVALLSAGAEARLLRRAGIIIAVQAEEAEAARRMAPRATVLVAPMAARPVAAPQPGQGGGLLFVGSATPPNIDAMRWFLAEAWPALHQRHPDLRLSIAGQVGTALAAQGHWPGVALLGRVADLAPLYTRADIVISPLRAGSGLKIKLVEAMAAGKAIIASPATLQGLDGATADAVMLAETAAEFIAAIDLLLRDGDQRAVLAGRALREAGTRFSAEAAYGPLIHALRQAIAAPAATTTRAA
jgi:succinoglycan biosynthesis protein ExoO